MDDEQPEIIILDSDSPEPVQPAHDELSCKNDVLLIFPNICPDYLAQLALEHGYKPDAVISVILDRQEQGVGYPTQSSAASISRKRKRSNGGSSDDDGEREGGGRCPESVRSIKLKIAADDYAANTASPKYFALARILISQDFPLVPQNTIRNLLLDNNRSVFATYTAMDEKLRNCGEGDMPWVEKKTMSKKKEEFTPGKISDLNFTDYEDEEQAAFMEFIAARELRDAKDAELLAEAKEREVFRQAKADKQTSECEICYEEFTFNSMVPCEGEPMHWFCRNCLKLQAESQVGMGKYEITCMSLGGCSAGFSQAQRGLFLDKKLTVALDRIEQEAVLRMAGIENLETCPFCSYAAEYPPVDVDKEFRCENPDCQLVSCRLCRNETHIPKSCAEDRADRGLDARHVLEEAMSEALIRRCNNCKNPFVKQDGCNKIKCTKCQTLQCDVCRQTIKDYSHFNDQRRGGKAGQCPLFDHSEERYEKEVSNAEAEMRKKVVKENPEMDEEALRITTSEEVKQVEDARKKAIPQAYQQWQRHQARFNPNIWPPEYHMAQYGQYAAHLNAIRNNHPIIPGHAVNRDVPPNPVPQPDEEAGRAKANEGLLYPRAPQQLRRPPQFRAGDVGIHNGMPILSPAHDIEGIENVMHALDRLRPTRPNLRNPNGIGNVLHPGFLGPRQHLFGVDRPYVPAVVSHIPYQLPADFVPHAFDPPGALANRRLDRRASQGLLPQASPPNNRTVYPDKPPQN